MNQVLGHMMATSLWLPVVSGEVDVIVTGEPVPGLNVSPSIIKRCVSMVPSTGLTSSLLIGRIV